MSRSYRHTPICGIAATKSDRWYKKIIHGQERARAREKIAHKKYDEAETELAPYDDWASAKDGKQYIFKKEKWFKPEEWERIYKKIMRK